MNNKIKFTDSAKNEINRILLNKSPKTYFRISVQGGGCSGFKYNFKFDEKIDKNDNIFDRAIIDNNDISSLYDYGSFTVEDYKNVDKVLREVIPVYIRDKLETLNIKKYGVKSEDLLQSVEFILYRKF